MIFRNKRQWFTADSYHTLNGSYTSKIRVINKTGSEFKHPYYEHSRFWYTDANTVKININGYVVPNAKTKARGATIHSVKIGIDQAYLATANIRSKTATVNHIAYAVERQGEYTHEVRTSMLNIDRIFVEDNTNYPSFVPRGANTDIYGNEQDQAAATGPKQTWIG